ncbi:MAG: HEAT repeat domain-containing protein [Sandaracinaceae bacterium]|nr:HEAT repeat domain-containing protein [Sandaracinaceae bacterium]
MDAREAQRRATDELAAGNAAGALTPLWALLGRSHMGEDELRAALALADKVYTALGARRAVATLRMFGGDLAGAQSLVRDVPLDRARLHAVGGDPQQAARAFEEAGWLGHAAIQLENAGDVRTARLLWERLTQDPRLRSNLYILGLVRFNLSRACAQLDDHAAARRERVLSMQAIEAAADGFETMGQRERAFDCYQVLLTLGKEGAFENLAEGYLGCIRILQADHLKYYVLQYYEDFTSMAIARGELHASATLLREAAQFCRRNRLPYEAHYRQRSAVTMEQAATKLLEDGGMPEMAENAFSAAIDGYNDLGQYSRVRGVYLRLATLQLPDKRRARYTRLAERLGQVPDEPLNAVGFPDYLRMDTAYPEIWRLDVIEWEQGGDAAETMGQVLEDPKTPDYIRRHALLCRLRQLGDPNPARPEALIALAELLGRVGIYACLGPLEAMVEHEDASVRAAVLRAARQLYFKRTFILVMRGLADDEQGVRREALAAVSTLHFGHAFDPLQRIYRDSQEPEVRAAALGAIGKIPNLEAAELLLEALAHGTVAERAQAADLLKRVDHPDVDALLRRAHGDETGDMKKRLGAVIQARGR